MYKVYCNKQNAKRTDWNIIKQSGRPEYQGPFLSPANRLVSTDRDLLTNLAQSCKPAAVGMFAYSSSVNICFYRKGPYSPKDNFKQFLANYKHACTANYYIRVQEKDPYSGEEDLWSTFRTGVIMNFQQRE